MTISRAQVYSSSRSSVFLKLTADQVLVFDWIAGSCQVNLLKTEPGCSMVVRKPVNSNPGLKVNQIITVSSVQMIFVYSFCFVIIKISNNYQKRHRHSDPSWRLQSKGEKCNGIENKATGITNG